MDVVSKQEREGVDLPRRDPCLYQKNVCAAILVTLAVVVTNVEDSQANPVAELSSRAAAPAAHLSMMRAALKENLR